LEKNNLNNKILTYYNLNDQIKKLGKIREKLNKEIKLELEEKKIDQYDGISHRAVLDEQERTYADNKKIKSFLIESGEKVDDYYNKKKVVSLRVVKIEKVMDGVDV